MLTSEWNKHNLTLIMWHVTFLQPLCLLLVLITLANHSPHHQPILITIVCSYPVTDLTDVFSIVTGLQLDRGFEPLMWIKYVNTDWLFFLCLLPRCPKEFFSQSGHQDQCSSDLGVSREQQSLSLHCMFINWCMYLWCMITWCRP